MKIKEARKIVGKLAKWFMLSQGIEVDKPEPITEDLLTLLKANDIVYRCNKKLIGKIGSHKFQSTMADRGIAAFYVAANFSGDNPATADVLALHGNNIVVCLNRDSIPNGEDDE